MEIKGGVLLYDGVHSERKRMAELLGLKRKILDRFFAEVTDAGMLIKTDDGYTMNRNYFVRGKVEYPLYQSLCVPYTKPLPLISWIYLPYDALRKCTMEHCIP